MHTLQSFQVPAKRGQQQERSVFLQLLKSVHACIMMVMILSRQRGLTWERTGSCGRTTV